MELWIRSQDKESLIKANNIYIICNCPEMPSTSSYSLYNYNKLKESWFGDFLGKYKTKERALEVLDDIEDKLINCTFAKKQNGLGETLDFMPNSIYVYTMPKE